MNMQYTKEEYEELVPKIIDHMKKTSLRLPDGSFAGQEWGQYLPPSFSPFPYNESVAHEYMPLTEQDAKALGFSWNEIKDELPNVTKIIDAKELPDSIDSIADDILTWAIRCEVSGRFYRIQKTELSYYREQKLPIPHRHPNVRYDDRLRLRNPRTLWKRACGTCGKETLSTFAPDRPEVIACEDCYRNSVV